MIKKKNIYKEKFKIIQKKNNETECGWNEAIEKNTLGEDSGSDDLSKAVDEWRRLRQRPLERYRRVKEAAATASRRLQKSKGGRTNGLSKASGGWVG